MLVTDIETSGLDPARHAIVSIGAVDYLDPARQLYLECRPHPGAEIEDGALAVNGFTREQLQDPARLPVVEALIQLCEWVEVGRRRVLAGSNVRFDQGFLQAACRRQQVPYPFGRLTVDLWSVWYARRLVIEGRNVPHGTISAWTDGILVYCGLPSEPKPHNALAGAKMEAEAFSRLIHGRGLLGEYEGHEVPEYLRREERI